MTATKIVMEKEKEIAIEKERVRRRKKLSSERDEE